MFCLISGWAGIPLDTFWAVVTRLSGKNPPVLSWYTSATTRSSDTWKER